MEAGFHRRHRPRRDRTRGRTPPMDAGGIAAGILGAGLARLRQRSVRCVRRRRPGSLHRRDPVFAVVMLTWHVTWMSHRSREMAAEMKQSTRAVRSASARWRHWRSSSSSRCCAKGPRWSCSWDSRRLTNTHAGRARDGGLAGSRRHACCCGLSRASSRFIASACSRSPTHLARCSPPAWRDRPLPYSTPPNCFPARASGPGTPALFWPTIVPRPRPARVGRYSARPSGIQLAPLARC